MLRLELNDNDETVLFIDPMKEVKIRKEKTEGYCCELCIETGNSVCYAVCYAVYDSERTRDAAYKYVLNKINDYLFPQIESITPSYVGPGRRSDLDDIFNPSSVGHV